MGVAAARYLRPVPLLKARGELASRLTVPGPAPRIPWPSSGEAALMVPGLGLLGSSGPGRPVPTASVAKVMTALMTLEAHPLPPGQPGPLVKVDPADVSVYEADLAQGQSTLAVVAGESLSERQLLEGLLIPSGNNIATLLGRWVAGSEASMVARANQEAARMGLAATHFADLSGFDPGTVSTPTDLIRLGEAAMALPAFAGIVGMSSALLPVAGRVANVDSALGQDGLIGIKTGSDDPAGGCFLFVSQASVGGRPVRVFGAVLGVPTLSDALAAGRRLSRAAAAGLTVQRVVAKGQEVGLYSVPWARGARAVVDGDLALLAWRGDVLRTRLELLSVKAPLARGAAVGTVLADLRGRTFRVTVRLAAPISAPGPGWRVLRSPS